MPIRVDGVEFPVTVNLHEALLRLRDPAIERIIWIDAVCIDQDDDTEKTHQIGLMSKIYGQANRVIIWLGEALPHGWEGQKSSHKSRMVCVPYPVSTSAIGGLPEVDYSIVIVEDLT